MTSLGLPARTQCASFAEDIDRLGVQIPPGASCLGFKSPTVLSLGSSVLKEYGRCEERLLSSTDKCNHETIRRFLDFELIRKGLSDRRRLKYVRVVRIILDLTQDRPLSELKQKDAEAFFFWLRDSNLSDDTKKSYWNVFRIFAEWVNSKIKVRDFKLKLRLKTKLPEEILSEEEASRLIETCRSIRDRALVSLTYHAAMRSGEVRNLKVKHLVFDQYGAYVMVPEEGKTGMRRIRIVEPVPLLIQYMQDHRFRDEPEAPLFYRQDKKTRTLLSSATLNNIIKEAARRAGIAKRVYPHLLRHSKATELAKKLTSQELMIYGGWRELSTVQVYTHLSGADIDKKILEINGIKPDSSNHTPIERPSNQAYCQRCGNRCDFYARFCSQCGSPLEDKRALRSDEMAEFQQFLVEMFQKWKSYRGG